jgi:hypothetical protein
MRYVCDAPGGKAWFRLETEAEAEAESAAMNHAVAKYFRRAWVAARAEYAPGPGLERDIGLKDHLARTMPLFLTLRADDGEALVTAMIEPDQLRSAERLGAIIVGPNNADPYPAHGEAIAVLGAHLGLSLDRARCYPYG